MSKPRPDEVSFGRGADRRLSRAVLDAAHAARRAPEGSPRAEMLEGLRTAAAGVAAALAATRAAGKDPNGGKKKATTALLVACGGLEQAIRVIAPGERRPARRLEKSSQPADRADESAA
jgi:hypothetical protein